MIDVRVLRAMAASGATAEAIISAVETEQAADLERQATAREKIRIRVKNHRARNGYKRDVTVTEKLNKNNDIAECNGYKRDVTVTHQNSNKNNAHVTVTANSATSLIEDKKESKKESRRGKICPPEFLPSKTHYEKGSNLGLSRGQVESACEDMRNWSQSNSNRGVARKSDWGLALHVWMKRWAAEIGAGKSARDQNNQKFYGKIPGII